jgi:hypothetical protein
MQRGLETRNVVPQGARALRRERHAFGVLYHARKFLRQTACRAQQLINGQERLHGTWQNGEERNAPKLLGRHTRYIKGTGLDHTGDAKQTAAINMPAMKYLVTAIRKTMQFQGREQAGAGPTRLPGGANAHRDDLLLLA